MVADIASNHGHILFYFIFFFLKREVRFLGLEFLEIQSCTFILFDYYHSQRRVFQFWYLLGILSLGLVNYRRRIPTSAGMCSSGRKKGERSVSRHGMLHLLGEVLDVVDRQPMLAYSTGVFRGGALGRAPPPLLKKTYIFY